MKEAQSPKNVESGENLYRCDPSTDHCGAVYFLSIKVIVVVFIVHWAGASSSCAMAWTTATCSTGGEPGGQGPKP